MKKYMTERMRAFKHTVATCLMLLMVAFGSVKAQFTLEKTYDHSLTVTRYNETDYAYFLMDVAKSECRIYTLDHVLWKTISINLPTDYYLYDIKFVTQNLFNTDSSFELWYSAYKWVATSSTDGYYQYISKVINESGTMMATINGGLYAYVINTGPQLYKFLVYAYDNSFYPGSVKTYLYALPGSGTAAVQPKAALTDPYPNPAEGGINLPLSPQSEQDVLRVFSAEGRLKWEQAVGQRTNVWVDTQSWKPGVYTYSVLSPNGNTLIKKFIVN
jgi:hypothetical protein